MSENIVTEDPSKVLKCFIDSEFFKNDPESGRRFMITLWNMKNHYTENEHIIEALKKNYGSLEKKYLEKLPFDYNQKIEKVKQGLQINHDFLNKLVSLYLPKFDYLKLKEEDYHKDIGFETGIIGLYFFNSLLRDWTEEFQGERVKNYGEVLKEFKKYFNYDDPNLNKDEIKILVPGTGCSRMAFEVAKKGFNLELNDLSYIYIFCCDYLFNYSHKNEFQICPRIYSFNHSFTEESVIKRYSFPDVNIKEELMKFGKKMNFIKGDFLKCYKGKKNLFDCIITIFFIDVAKNIMELVEVMHDLLKPGGVWINLGTLDYYLSEECGSIDLTWDELRHVIIQTGFDLQNEEQRITPYGNKEGCTVSYDYGTVFFSAVKK